MKSSLLLGFVLALVGGLLFYLQFNKTNNYNYMELLIGGLLGLGVGLIFGAIIGYFSKSSSIKKSNKLSEESNYNSTIENSSVNNTDL